MHTRKVYLYVFDTMSDWEYGYLIAELNSGRYFKKGLEPLKVITVSTSNKIITTMGGLNIMPDICLNDCHLQRNDLIILPGGNTWGEAVHQPLLEKVRHAFENGALVAAICGATEALANNGYLNTRTHTSNNLEYFKAVCPNYKGEHLHVIETVACDLNLVTASGIAPLEFAREVN